MAKNRRTEHAGPKNGFRSFWGRRAEAKQVSKKRRRTNDQKVVIDAARGCEINEPA